MKNPLTTPDQSGETLGEAILAGICTLIAIPSVVIAVWIAVGAP